MARVAERGAELGHDVYTVRAGAVPTEKAYIEALADAGFVFCRQHARMRMSLDGVSPTPPAPPAGVTVRALRPDDEAEMRRFHEVIETSFRDSDHPSAGYDGWRQQIDGQPTKSWDEWFVAETDGEIVGALQSADGDRDEGWVGRLGVLRAYRKRSVGESLLRHAFAAYVRNGRGKAGLGVDMENPTRAMRLYLAVGMTSLYQANVYQTTVTAAGRA
jgi:mycothiol synthase